MNTLSCCLGAAVLLSAAGAINTNQTPLVQASASRPSQAGYVIKKIPFSAVHHQQANAPRWRLWDSTSGNWSGYAVPLDTSGTSDTFSYVQGTWVVPKVTGTGGKTTYSSVWVGIDGYADGTVEQIGTEQDWYGKKQQNYVWFEMYPNAAYEILGFPANPGDSISAQVVYQGSGVFQLTIWNNTSGVSYTVPPSYTTVAPPALSSAEWIVEAPSSINGILPLANFGTVYFANCQATGLLGTGAINLWPYDPLTMVDPKGGKAVPSKLSSNGTAFSVSYSSR